MITEQRLHGHVAVSLNDLWARMQYCQYDCCVAGDDSRGAAAADFGLATTPAMFMSCILPGERCVV